VQSEAEHGVQSTEGFQCKGRQSLLVKSMVISKENGHGQHLEELTNFNKVGKKRKEDCKRIITKRQTRYNSKQKLIYETDERVD
jgi:hypothetical protein